MLRTEQKHFIIGEIDYLWRNCNCFIYKKHSIGTKKSNSTKGNKPPTKKMWISIVYIVQIHPQMTMKPLSKDMVQWMGLLLPNLEILILSTGYRKILGRESYPQISLTRMWKLSQDLFVSWEKNLFESDLLRNIYREN